MVDTDYRKYNCYTKMDPADQLRFDKLVDSYGDVLNNVLHDKGVVYTAHDFNHHCCNLYRIISELILSDTAYGDNGSNISDRELYILNVAVLLHDIGMTDIRLIDRDSHAVKSAELIDEKYRNPSDTLCQDISGLTENDIKAIKAIVRAHHDLETESFGSALRNPDLTDELPCKGGKVRAQFLAAILRLSDELDITNERIQSQKVFDQLSRTEKEIEKARINGDKKIKELENSLVSLQHWKDLRLFTNLDREQNGDVYARIDDEYINEKRDRGESIEGLAERITGISNKITKELELFHSIIDVSRENCNLTVVSGFYVKTNNDALKRLISKSEDIPSVSSQSGIDESKPQVKILSKDMKKRISSFIKEKNLIEGGHFYRNDGYCARDWINVREITGTGWFFKRSEEIFIEEISRIIQKENKSFFIIGIDFAGMLIGSKVAFVLNIPYTYAIPEGDGVNASDRELMEPPPSDIDSVIVMTDVIVTYNTIKGVLKRYNLSDRLRAIYGVLYREPRDDRKELNLSFELIEKTYVLNDEFPIELRCNDECVIRNSHRCIAMNLDKQ